MADVCFTACTNTREHVCNSIAKLALHTNDSSQCNHNAAMMFIAGIHCILCETYNPGGPGNGMDKLSSLSNTIARIKSINVATSTMVLNEANRIACSLSTGTTTVTPTIT